MLTVLVETRVEHASLKTDFVPLLKMTRLFLRVQQPNQYVLPEMTHAPEVTTAEAVCIMVMSFSCSNKNGAQSLLIVQELRISERFHLNSNKTN
ncbi:hypothetical protein Hanom_Chr01g00000921 [Helianthus anomalus]